MNIIEIDKPDASQIGGIVQMVVTYCEQKLNCKESSVLLLAREEGGTIGGIFFWWYGRDAVIEMFAVDERHRRKGIGSALLSKAEARLAEANCRQIMVSTMAFQAPGFYDRHGYSLTAKIPDYFGGSDLCIYRKLLQA